MSEILNRLKQAEAERERIIAERRRVETEADAALAEREREERVQAQQRAARPQPAQAAQDTREQRSRFAAGLGIAVALAIVFWAGTLVPRSQPESDVKPAAAPAVRPIAPARVPPPGLFRMDADIDGFAARVKDRPMADKP